MTDFTQFINNTPIIIPPIEAKIYDKYWLRALSINAPTTTGEATLYAEFRPCRDLLNSEGNVVSKELKEPEVDGDIKVVKIDNLFNLAYSNQNFAIAMESVFAALKEYAFPDPIVPPEEPSIEPEDPIMPPIEPPTTVEP
jgi:hypothetical protein